MFSDLFDNSRNSEIHCCVLSCQIKTYTAILVLYINAITYMVDQYVGFRFNTTKQKLYTKFKIRR